MRLEVTAERRATPTAADTPRQRALAVALLLGLLLALVPSAPPARAMERVNLPLAAGTAVRIIQGYNGGTHRGRSRLALDLVLTNGGTAGAAVIAPFSGRISWASPSGSGNGCLSVTTEDRSYSMLLCHVVTDSGTRAGRSVSAGQRLGAIGRAGTVGNNGTAHLHIELHRGTYAQGPVPFAGPNGISLEGVELPDNGRANQHAGRAPIVAGGAPSTQPLAAPPPESPPPAATPAPAPPPAAPAPRAPAASERAVVAVGAGDCLKVRAAPSVSAEVRTCLADGTAVTLVGAAERVDGRAWRQIENRGWSAAEYLQPPGQAAQSSAPPPAATPRPASAERAVVAVGAGDCLKVRAAPATSAETRTCLADGTTVTLVGAPERADGYIWRQIENRGWSAAEYLRPARD